MPYASAVLLAIFSTMSCSSPGMLLSNQNFNRVSKVIDSHVHIWSDGIPPFTYNVEPPPVEIRGCQAGELLRKLDITGVKFAIVIQPINHGFDHSYLESVISSDIFAKRLLGVCLLNPKLPISEGLDYLSQLKVRGFIGVRFNPYLFSDEEPLNSIKGIALYKHAGHLSMPVGFMCFRGLDLHYSQIVDLLDASPTTVAIIDHMGFFFQNGKVNEESWSLLLSLSQFPQVFVKISALFRVSNSSPLSWPYLDIDERLLQLVEAFGSDRLMFGSDYPFVEQLDGGYEKIVTSMDAWPLCQERLTEADWENIYGKTAARVYNIPVSSRDAELNC